MSAQNPTVLLPLFAPDGGPWFRNQSDDDLDPPHTLRRTPAVQKGRDGADDAAKHLKDHAPGWVLEALGDALLSLRGQRFSSDDVRRIAGPTVDAWLTDEPERVNVFSGWWQRRVKKFKLVRVGSTESTREDRRGAWIALWEFPVA